jgi:hypothetical protein
MVSFQFFGSQVFACGRWAPRNALTPAMSSSSHGWPGGWGGPRGLLLGPVLGDGVSREAAGHEVVLDELALGLHQVDALQRLLKAGLQLAGLVGEAALALEQVPGDGVGLLEGPRLGAAPIVGRLMAPWQCS